MLTRVDDQKVTEALTRLPPHLYRFESLTEARRPWVRDLVVRSQLYFPAPTTFNDPLECRVVPTPRASRLQAYFYWLKVARREMPDAAKREQKRRARGMARKMTSEGGKEILAGTLQRVLQTNGTACFATDPTSVLMWAYYARGHAGIALRFGSQIDDMLALGQALQEQGTFLLPIEVLYHDAFPEAELHSEDKFHFLRAVLGTKSTAWAHEGEWRIVLPNRTGLLTIPRSWLNGIIFGMRTSRDDETMLREWVRERGGGVEFQRVVHKPGSFQLELQPA